MPSHHNEIVKDLYMSRKRHFHYWISKYSHMLYNYDNCACQSLALHKKEQVLLVKC